MTMTHATKERLLEAGLAMLLERGYYDLGIQAVLDATRIPRGSFYHHFAGKEDFALQVVDRYMAEVHAALEACLGDRTRTPLERIRSFFEGTREKYATEGYLGCLLGGLGQELSGINEGFRRKIEDCFTSIGRSLAKCLEEAGQRGELPPGADPERMADVLVDCWEGAALRTRLRRDPAPLDAMLDFYFRAAAAS
jgi:TetR/AcrR family transcriptional regulator, transcriptional repressor for nem operon